MSIASKTIESSNLTIFTMTGEVVVDEVVATLRSFFDGKPTLNVLWDMRKLTGRRLSDDNMHQIAAVLAQHKDERPSGKTAVVADADVDFGIARMGEMIADAAGLSWTIRAFRSLEAALQWIDEDAPRPQQ